MPRAVVRVTLEAGIVIYGVHLNSSGLGFCRMSDAIKGASELREKAEGLGLTDAARSITEAISAVEKAIPAARDPGIGATTAEARRRALSREAAASFIVEAAKSSIQAGESVLVAGDFNTAVSEPCKTGADLDRDFEGIIGCSTILKAEQCSGDDGYDDTYHIFTSGDDGRPAFEITTKNLGKTYAKGEFADSPIDNVLVAGPFKEKAFTATKFGRPDDQQAVFGSDHHAVDEVRLAWAVRAFFEIKLATSRAHATPRGSVRELGTSGQDLQRFARVLLWSSMCLSMPMCFCPFTP